MTILEYLDSLPADERAEARHNIFHDPLKLPEEIRDQLGISNETAERVSARTARKKPKEDGVKDPYKENTHPVISGIVWVLTLPAALIASIISLAKKS